MNIYQDLEKFLLDKLTDGVIIKSAFHNDTKLIPDNLDTKGMLIRLLANISYYTGQL